MQIPSDATASAEASIHIDATPDAVYELVSSIDRMGEWSSENVGGDWQDGATGKAGDWFVGHNRAGDREWSRDCQVATAEPGRDFTFVVDGVEANCTWWSYELAPADGGGTTLTERWWFVNKTAGLAAATPEQLAARIEGTGPMLESTLQAIKATAEG